jgi:hypothetical protein
VLGIRKRTELAPEELERRRLAPGVRRSLVKKPRLTPRTAGDPSPLAGPV